MSTELIELLRQMFHCSKCQELKSFYGIIVITRMLREIQRDARGR